MKILGVLLGLLLLQSCTKADDRTPICENCNFTCLDSIGLDVFSSECKENWTCIFKVSAQSSVDLSNVYGLGSGNKNVFQMISSTAGSPSIADDEFLNVLVFELDESQNSF